jgi:hypothetical protein
LRVASLQLVNGSTLALPRRRPAAARGGQPTRVRFAALLTLPVASTAKTSTV